MELNKYNKTYDSSNSINDSNNSDSNYNNNNNNNNNLSLSNFFSAFLLLIRCIVLLYRIEMFGCLLIVISSIKQMIFVYTHKHIRYKIRVHLYKHTCIDTYIHRQTRKYHVLQSYGILWYLMPVHTNKKLTVYDRNLVLLYQLRHYHS